MKAHRTRQAEGGHHLLDGAHHKVDDRALEQAQLIPHSAQHDVLHGAAMHAVLQRLGKVLDDDDGLCTRVLELMLQLAGGVQRIDVDHHKARTQHSRHGNRVLRHIGHHQRHAIAALQAQALQIGGEDLALCIDLRKGQLLAHEGIGNLAGVPGKRLFHQRNQGWVLRWIDICRNSLWIGAEPRTVTHSFRLHVLMV